MKQNVDKLKHREGITFRWDKKGAGMVNSRAKKMKMNKSEYLRYCVELEAKYA